MKKKMLSLTSPLAILKAVAGVASFAIAGYSCGNAPTANHWKPMDSTDKSVSNPQPPPAPIADHSSPGIPVVSDTTIKKPAIVNMDTTQKKSAISRSH
jgi:hypothetical protein